MLYCWCSFRNWRGCRSIKILQIPIPGSPHPPFYQPPPSLPPDSSQLSHTKRPEGVHREQRLGDDTGSPFNSVKGTLCHKLTVESSLSTNCWSLCVLSFSLFTALSGSSSNAKYDPDQIKVEIACRRERVSHYQRRTMGCSEGPFWAQNGAGVWPLQDTVALARGLKRMRMRSSSKGQTKARSLTHRAKLDISLRSVTWVRVFPGSGTF